MIRTSLLLVLTSLAALAGPGSVRVAGRVLGPDGRPLAGAVVGMGLAATTGGELSPVSPATTKASGAFSLRGPEGKVGITVTAKGCLPFFQNVDLHAGVPMPPLEVRLEKGGILLQGRLVAAPGRRLRGVRLGFSMLSQREGDQFFPRLAHGRFEASLAPGRYLVRAEGGGQHSELQLDLREPRRALNLQLIPDPSPAGPEVRSWIKARALPLRTVLPGGDPGDLAPLRRIIGDAQVVGLGEATHGTREFFQLKHRVFQFLVESMGFTALAMEANHADSQAIEDYIRTGEGDAALAVARLGLWIWDTEEVVALVRWMRDYNADPNHPRKLHFYGVDMQSDREALSRARTWLAQAAPEEALVLDGLERRAAGLPWFYTGALPAEASAAWRGIAREVHDMIERLQRRGGLDRELAASTRDAMGLQDLRVYSQWAAMMGVEAPASPYRIREESMAANLQWVLNREPGGRVALWAHNAHLAFKADEPFPSLGTLLKQRLGKAYLPIGLFFRQGAFRAHPRRQRWEVSPVSSATLNEALASTGYPRFALDLRGLPPGGRVKRWFQEPQGFWAIGSFFNPAKPEAYLEQAVLPTCCEALFFLDATEASEPTHGGFGLKPRPRVPSGPVEPDPVNLGFEAGKEASGWVLNPGPDFTVAVVEGGAKEGANGLRGVPRTEATEDAWWSVSQRVDAAPFRGKRIRISAWVRTEGGPGLQAELRGTYDTLQRPTMDLTRGYLADPTGWTEIQCEGPVGQNATVLEVELTLRGKGTSWVDGFRIDPLP